MLQELSPAVGLLKELPELFEGFGAFNGSHNPFFSQFGIPTVHIVHLSQQALAAQRQVEPDGVLGLDSLLNLHPGKFRCSLLSWLAGFGLELQVHRALCLLFEHLGHPGQVLNAP